MTTDEMAQRRNLLRELDEEFAQLRLDEKAGVKEAHRLEIVHAEELRRAIAEWKERLWFARKALGDEEATARSDELQGPESTQWTKLSNMEGRARRRAMAESDERQRREAAEEDARLAAEAERKEQERRARQDAIDAELAREREKERRALLERQATQRTRMVAKEEARRLAHTDQFDAWRQALESDMARDRADCLRRQSERQLRADIAVIEAAEAEGRSAIQGDADRADPPFQERLAAAYAEALRDERRHRMEAVWDMMIPVEVLDAAMDLEDEESECRRAIAYQHETAFRSWVDAISIDERFIETQGRRRTTQAQLAVNAEEFEERQLVELLEGLLRLQVEAAFDRALLADWEERCTDALHAFAIDTIDAYLTLGLAGIARVGDFYYEPHCHPRTTFYEDGDDNLLNGRARSRGIPSLAMGSSFALTPRPPPSVLAAVSTTPGRLRERLTRYELRGAPGSTAHLHSRMQRFDEECRSEFATPFADATYRSSRGGFSSHTPGELLPAITSTPIATTLFPAIADRPTHHHQQQQGLSDSRDEPGPSRPVSLPGSPKPPPTAPALAGRPTIPRTRPPTTVPLTPAAFRRLRTASSADLSKTQ